MNYESEPVWSAASAAETASRAAARSAVQLKGIDAQVESARELELLREQVNALLKHSRVDAEQQAVASQERDKVEAARFRENIRMSRVAAWAGVISAILSAIAIWK